ncbi:MAG: hypothetical protein DUD27_01440 [Lachnospiraceae bacterium]|uniref:YkgJ family cysteine cluster protein n=1 Tax=Candidatus Weimeria bifida TaxID=2599074 RepID=A0A6N7IYK6_9FIRM|nr:hypothetical protein [Candidatus Weimeria bifida]RRF97251.1 MAG: hypothetical protein DUD27_01440 [Lachnospiraceae bacterium]
MKTSIVEFARHYSCLMGNCPQHCCHGWTIPVDEDTWSVIKKEPGKSGERVRSHIKGTNDDNRQIRKNFGSCPFLAKDKLCGLQKQGREDLMPLVCRQFPHQVLDLGDRREVTLLLSCYVAAKAFCEHPDEIRLIPGGDDLESYYIIENRDEPFLDFLLAERKKLLDAIADTSHELPLVFGAVYAYAAATNARYLSNATRDSVTEITLSFDKNDWGSCAALDGSGYEFFPISLMDRCIVNFIDYGFLFSRNNLLWNLIRKYKKLFGPLYESEADKWLEEELLKLYAEEPSFALRHRSYFYYTMLELYPLAYESYFWQRQTLLSIFYTELLMIFDVTEYATGKKVPDKEKQIEILCSFERGTRHNPSMTENIYNTIRSDFI